MPCPYGLANLLLRNHDGKSMRQVINLPLRIPLALLFTDAGVDVGAGWKPALALVNHVCVSQNLWSRL